ncbi:DUF192 domain-containing protein [Candidatus Micrarchaeota archaeon]|nr:DUF192 domain-containing protein [Candidatus Micrarchaeota archaeon]
MRITIGTKRIGVELADNWAKRFRGLMFRRKCAPLLLSMPHASRANSTIHSFFVFFRFDAVFLDDKKRVINVVDGVRPFRVAVVPKRPARYVLELPAGMARGLGIRENMKLAGF